ncbi:hypothetical protein [Aquabacterium sp.]|uniref:hypothetical protein n=1 Tax=Aquabacterium sp. TaxID=1872578 RepID=UPI00378396AC
MIDPMRRALAPFMAAALIAGCGGGNADAPVTRPTADAESAPAVLDARIGLADYLAVRNRQAVVSAFPTLSDAERASVFSHSRARAVATLNLGSALSVNDLVVLPLTESFVRLIAGSARGQTLAELLARYPADLGPNAAAAQTQGVQRQLAARADARFLPEFLAGSENLEAGLPLLGSWSAVVLADWADLKRSTVMPGALPSTSLVPTDNTRLVVWDAWSELFSWPRTEAFDGVYANELGGRQKLPMLRIKGSVKRYEGDTFVAWALEQSGRLLLALQPRSGTLQDFAGRGYLDSALRDAVHALQSPSLAAEPGGEMVLPVLSKWEVHIPGDAWSAGLTLPFDMVNADLRGLDGGGTYLRAGVADRRLEIAAEGLIVEAAQSVAFEFSPRNRFDPVSAGLTIGTNTGFPRIPAIGADPCGRATPDLRSFFVALIDAQQRVTALASIRALDGPPCQ